MTEQSDSSRPMSEGAECDKRSLLAKHRLSIDVVRQSGDWTQFEPVEDLIGACAQKVVGALSDKSLLPDAPACIAVALLDDTSVQALNKTFRGSDKPTNVLSFPSPGPAVDGPCQGDPLFLGDIALASETLLREAAELGIPPNHHFQHLIVHGILHIFEYDHDTDAAAADMEGLEVRLLSELGIPNPYAD